MTDPSIGYRSVCRRGLFRSALAGLLLLGQPGAGLADEVGRKALPVDEAARYASFAAWRAELIEAVARRDTDAVVAAASEDVQLSFGGHAGPETFRDLLTRSGDEVAEVDSRWAATLRAEYWDALEGVLRLGGRFTGPGRFEAPYVATEPLAPGDDPFTTGFVTGRSVILRDRPSRFGRPIGSLGYDVVEVLEGGAGTDYREVRTPAGARGYVHEDFLHRPVDHRAVFEKRGGRWRMTSFLHGD